MAKSAVRMSDVARLAGVSTMTVSRVLSRPDSVALSTRERVLDVIHAQGFVPNGVAGSLRAQRGHGVACVVPHIANSVFSDTLQGLNDALRPASMHVLLGTSGYSHEEEARVLEEFARLRPEAIVLWGTRRHHKSRAFLRRMGAPVIEIFDLVPDPFDQVIGFSNELAMRTMVEALLRQGRRRIAFVGNANDLDLSAAQRVDGWRIALMAAGIDPAGLLFEAEPSATGGEEIFRKIIGAHVAIDAVCCVNDLLAIGILSECRRLKVSVPEQLAIAGFGDFPFSQAFAPALTSVRLPRYAIGKAAGQQILKRLAGEAATDRVIDLGFQIMLRAST